MKKKKVSPAQELDGVGTQRLKSLGLAGGRAKRWQRDFGRCDTLAGTSRINKSLRGGLKEIFPASRNGKESNLTVGRAQMQSGLELWEWREEFDNLESP